MADNDKVLVPRELLPCPFCGGDAELDQMPDDGSLQALRWAVGCIDDYCNGFRMPYRHSRKAGAIEAWNRRAAAPQPAEDDDIADDPTTMQIEYARGHADGVRDGQAWLARGAPAAQPAEDELPELPERMGTIYVYEDGAFGNTSTKAAYTAGQMLAFRAEGIAYAQHRSAGVVVDEAMAREYKRWIDFYHAGEGDYADFLRIELAEPESGEQAALSREEG